MNVVMIPSASAGLGHIARTATLARTLRKLDPTVNVEYLLDVDRLRPFNIDATARTGFKVNLLPPRPRAARNAIVRTCLGHADVIVDDTMRFFVPFRADVPKAAWVSIPMYPIVDEIFMDWPFLAQMDAIIWAYPPVLDYLPELELTGVPVLKTGPFLQIDHIPPKEQARAELGLAPDDEIVIYSPRGMTFGIEFGHIALRGVYGGAEALRADHPRLKLVLLAVSNPEEIRVSGVPTELPEWVTVVDTVPPDTMLRYIRAADIAVTEGSNMTQEAAALGTPVVMIPGTIFETWLLATRLWEQHAAHVNWIERVTPESMAEMFRAVLEDTEDRHARINTARSLVTAGEGGVEAAARLVLSLAGKGWKGARRVTSDA